MRYELTTSWPYPITVATGAVLGALTSAGIYVHDTDDFLGSFALHVSFDGVTINHTFRALDRAIVLGELPDPAHRLIEFRFQGDGSNIPENLDLL